MERIYVDSFTDLEAEFMARVFAVVWCNVATLDTKNRLRSRIWHPIWEGARGWVITRRNTLKAKHLAHHPYVSLAYIADISNPVYADCAAEWVDDLGVKQQVWDLFKNAPASMGYDFGNIFPAIDDPDLGLLKFTPWRIELASVPTHSRIWLADKGSEGLNTPNI
jgi:general stress protein 26